MISIHDFQGSKKDYKEYLMLYYAGQILSGIIANRTRLDDKQHVSQSIILTRMLVDKICPV